KRVGREAAELSLKLISGIVRTAPNPLISALGAFVGRALRGVFEILVKPLNHHLALLSAGQSSKASLGHAKLGVVLQKWAIWFILLGRLLLPGWLLRHRLIERPSGLRLQLLEFFPDRGN